ncbi:MAG: hypothetical protein LBL66_01095, partial [Clostridiales bacterium]|nr:hypothetical protein [Clostridiales bacterium]
MCDEWNNPAFQESSEYYNIELSQKIRDYDEDFFSGRILVVYSFWSGHDKETRINGIEVDGTKLIVNARYKKKRGTYTTEAFTWLILIEVNKTDVTGVTSVQVE